VRTSYPLDLRSQARTSSSRYPRKAASLITVEPYRPGTPAALVLDALQARARSCLSALCRYGKASGETLASCLWRLTGRHGMASEEALPRTHGFISARARRQAESEAWPLDQSPPIPTVHGAGWTRGADCGVRQLGCPGRQDRSLRLPGSGCTTESKSKAFDTSLGL
jgi:hypothetical protein